MTVQSDIVIVGGGLSGYTAAATAAEAGATVTILEKTAHSGGNVLFSGASFVFAGTDMQREHGLDDTPELLETELLAVGGGYSDEGLVHAYVEEQLDTYEWMRGIGIEFPSLSLSSNQSRPRSHSVKVKQAFDALAAYVATFPSVQVVYEHAAYELIVNEGRVVGVRSHTPDGDVETYAGQGVLLATGGFNWSKRAVRAFAPRFLSAIPLGNPAVVGDGLYMSMALGADLSDMGFLAGTFGTTAPFPGINPEPRLLVCMYRGAMIVNKLGLRFGDESISYKKLADLCLAQEGSLGFQVFDEQVMSQSNPDKSVNDFRGALDQGYLLSADTLEELAEKMGAPADAFVSTVQAYNDAIAAGEGDEFGRTSLAAGYGKPTPLNEPPYYAYPCTVGLPSTYGGVKTDPELRVVHVSGEPIPGLYAAGEIVGGFHGQGYISGTSLSKSVVLARIAGRTMASLEH